MKLKEAIKEIVKEEVERETRKLFDEVTNNGDDPIITLRNLKLYSDLSWDYFSKVYQQKPEYVAYCKLKDFAETINELVEEEGKRFSIDSEESDPE